MISRWEECLRVFTSINATDLIFEPNSKTRYKVGANWQVSDEDPWSAEICDQLCLSLLSEAEKHQLADRRYIRTILSRGDSRFRIHISVQSGGFGFHVHRLFSTIPKIQDATIVRAATDLFQVQRGLIILCSGHGQGKTTTAGCILQHEMMREFRSSMIYEECEELSFSLPVSRVRIGRDLQLDSLTAYSGSNRFSQIHCFDIGFEKNSIESAMFHAASGQLAILVLPFDGALSAVKAVAHGLRQWNLNHYAEQLGTLLHAAIGQTLVPARESSVLPCFEICTATPSVREKIKNFDFDAIEKLMSQSGDTSGMRSLNQSLLQLVLRRKIEMKEAFQHSRRPEELDQMLNKAGI